MLGTSKEEFERLLPQFEKVFIETKLSKKRKILKVRERTSDTLWI